MEVRKWCGGVQKEKKVLRVKRVVEGACRQHQNLEHLWRSVFWEASFFLLIFFFPKKTKITDRYYNHAVRFDVQSSGSDRDIAGRQAGATAGNMCIPRAAIDARPEDLVCAWSAWSIRRASHPFFLPETNSMQRCKQW